MAPNDRGDIAKASKHENIRVYTTQPAHSLTLVYYFH